MTIQINSIYDFEETNGCERSDYFLKKELHELSVEDLAYIHLDTLHACTPIKGCKVMTSLKDLIDNASRSFSNDATKKYTPVLICFSILDQLGSIYKSKNKDSSSKNCIKQFLEHFGGYSEQEISALVSLRNGLSHDGSLLCISRHKNKPHVIFHFSPKLNKTIQISSKEWDGIFYDSMNKYLSFLNLKLFFEDICNMIKICEKKLIANELELKINDPREFYYKFLSSNLGA